jgi:hypothetical protein
MSTSAKRLMLRRHFIGAAVLGLSAGMSAGMPAQAQTTTPTITSFTAGDLVINVEGNGSNTFAAAQAAYPGIYGSGTKSLSVNNIHLRRDTPEADDGCGEHVECDE